MTIVFALFCIIVVALTWVCIRQRKEYKRLYKAYERVRALYLMPKKIDYETLFTDTKMKLNQLEMDYNKLKIELQATCKANEELADECTKLREKSKK